MNDYIDETPLTDEEIAAAIAAAKKAKAEKVRAQKAMLEKAEKPEEPQQTEAKDEESTESLFNEIDSAAENDEKLSPKMASARSFSNAFAAARMRREKDLLKKKAEKAAEQEEEEQSYIEEDVTPAQTYDEDYEEEVVFEADGEYKEYNEEEYGEYEESEGYEEYDNSEEYASEEYVSDEYESEEYATEFEVDGEEDGYENYADEDSGEYEGIFQPDEEDTPNYGERVSVDEYEEYDDEDDDEDDEDEDEEESTFSTKTKVIIGVIIAVLVLAIIGAGIVFFSKGGDDEPVDSDTTSAADGTEVKSLKFAEPSVSLRVGESVALDIIIEPETATDKTLKLKSNDTSIVTVGEDGKITGVASGSTTVTATLKSNETITATLIVNVINEKQNALNIYNDFVNSILDGSTDIDSDSDTDEAVEDTETDTESNSDTETDTSTAEVAEDVLTGSIIRDLNGDDALELALLYANKNEGSSVRIFYLADENSDEDVDTEEVMYDEYGNIIESTETDTSEEENTDSEEATVSEKVLTELDIYSEMYSVCYNAIETEAIGWNTCFAEVKEEEVVQARVTILSDEYTSPTYVYETSDETVATVDTQGNIKGIKPGTCFITVTSPLNSEAMAKIKIRVKDDTDLLEDYLAQVPIVNYTNDAVIPTETLTGKAITDIDNDGVSELLLRFSYGNNVETINMVKIENEQCVVYKTYKNLSDLYDFYEGDGSYSNNVLIHYTTGAVCMEYKGIVAKKDSKTKTSEQRIYSVEDNGSLSELVNFTTTTDISTKTVTSEVVIEDTDTSSYYEDSDEWYDSDYYYEDSDSEYYEDTDSSYDDGGYYEESYATFTFDDVVRGGISFADKTAGKTLPQTVGEPEDGDSDYYEDEDYTSSEYDYDEDYDDDEVSKVTSTVTSEIIEESTKYFVNGTPVEQSVYEETLSSYSARYSVWSSWESVY